MLDVALLFSHVCGVGVSSSGAFVRNSCCIEPSTFRLAGSERIFLSPQPALPLSAWRSLSPWPSSFLLTTTRSTHHLLSHLHYYLPHSYDTALLSSPSSTKSPFCSFMPQILLSLVPNFQSSFAYGRHLYRLLRRPPNPTRFCLDACQARRRWNRCSYCPATISTKTLYEHHNARTHCSYIILWT